MIIDSISNSHLYENLHPLFAKAFAYLRLINLSNPEIGKTELDGKNLFVMISDSKLKPKEEAKLEAHEEYIDIQIPISGLEGFGWKARANLQETAESIDKSKDIQFFTDKPSIYFDLEPKHFCIFFPEDAHAPCIGTDSVIKIVFKVKLNP